MSLTLGTIDLDSSLWATALALCAAIGAVAWWRWSRDRSLSLRDVDREHRARIREQARISKTLTELMEALETAAARVNQQLDERFASLERAIDAADRRIVQLSAPPPPETPAAAANLREIPARLAPAPRQIAVEMPVDPAGQARLPQTSPARTVIRQRTGLAQAARPTPRSDPALSAGATTAEVIAAARAGASALVIARQTGRPVGEIQLLLDLARFAADSTRANSTSTNGDAADAHE